MAGILANSADRTMVGGDAAEDQEVSGFVTRSRVTLSVTPAPTSRVRWTLTRASDASRAELTSATAETPSFLPDVSGVWVVTAQVDGATDYALRLTVLERVGTLASGTFRLMPVSPEQVLAPAGGKEVFLDRSSALIKAKDSDGNLDQFFEGPQGEQGERGDPGATGLQGPPGPPGEGSGTGHELLDEANDLLDPEPFDQTRGALVYDLPAATATVRDFGEVDARVGGYTSLSNCCALNPGATIKLAPWPADHPKAGDPHVLDANLPAGVTLKFKAGAVLEAADDVTVAARLDFSEGGLVATNGFDVTTTGAITGLGVQQIWDTSGGGQVIGGIAIVQRVNAAWFGCHPDTVDNSIPINAAILNAASCGCGSVDLPSPRLPCLTSIVTVSGVSLYGVAQAYKFLGSYADAGTILDFSDATPGTAESPFVCVDRSGTPGVSSGQRERACLDHLVIIGPGKLVVGVVGVLTKDARYNTAHHVSIINCDSGFRFDRTNALSANVNSANHCTNCFVNGCMWGFDSLNSRGPIQAGFILCEARNCGFQGFGAVIAGWWNGMHWIDGFIGGNPCTSVQLYGGINNTIDTILENSGTTVVQPAWTTGTVYAVGNIVSNGANLYRATSAGTSGATAPVHLGGFASDGGVSWQWGGLTDCFDIRATDRVGDGTGAVAESLKVSVNNANTGGTFKRKAAIWVDNCRGMQINTGTITAGKADAADFAGIWVSEGVRGGIVMPQNFKGFSGSKVRLKNESVFVTIYEEHSYLTTPITFVPTTIDATPSTIPSLFVDAADGILKFKDSNNVLHSISVDTVTLTAPTAVAGLALWLGQASTPTIIGSSTSIDPDLSTWTGTNCTKAVATGEDPVGGDAAYRITDSLDSIATLHSFARTPSSWLVGPTLVDLWLAPDTLQWCRVLFGAGSKSIYIDLGNAALGSGQGGATARHIEGAAGGWQLWRCQADFASGTQVLIRPASFTTVPVESYVGDGTGAILVGSGATYGPRLEQARLSSLTDLSGSGHTGTQATDASRMLWRKTDEDGLWVPLADSGGRFEFGWPADAEKSLAFTNSLYDLWTHASAAQPITVIEIVKRVSTPTATAKGFQLTGATAIVQPLGRTTGNVLTSEWKDNAALDKAGNFTGTMTTSYKAIATTFDGTNQRVYVNGVLDATGAVNRAVGAQTFTAAAYAARGEVLCDLCVYTGTTIQNATTLLNVTNYLLATDCGLPTI